MRLLKLSARHMETWPWKRAFF